MKSQGGQVYPIGPKIQLSLLIVVVERRVENGAKVPRILDKSWKIWKDRVTILVNDSSLRRTCTLRFAAGGAQLLGGIEYGRTSGKGKQLTRTTKSWLELALIEEDVSCQVQ